MISKDVMKRLGGVFWSRVLPCRHGNCPSAGQRGATHGADAQLGGADAVPDNVPGATGCARSWYPTRSI
ncbi:hypothetical protein ATY48_07225 [Xanthomonas oryzae pv. oryzae]|uniref:Uncharacterized protein n=2 Tax=Xanthomonas oryzae pv. oryzae TaxID=64187 RepID=Q5H2P9_XANOR|nr:conserved hypothetical protein [Xanthomonas oryzae pv. oryzae KACC 10331]ACD58050.1 hypothetical protein PXO_04804 [Xanthomonas oryzae pv. oryzae PXO99A]AJQ84053.1 hypothetical protein AZ54_16835 [Xanthomonas oryzae pv. oryzae PXO86]ALZ72736.1 hypothetical protein APZ20_15795 [Xanthomonas oryzae pv. oryzae]AOS01870.1 hypothetical protein ATY42_07215 [Xanthomonas oryzae pv. oryzae]